MNKIKYYVGAICLALSLNSCSDFLDEEPVSEIPADKMWQTARDAKAGVNEIYGLLRTTLRENYFYWGEFRSDNVAPGAPVMADQARVINNLMSTDESCARWTNLYQMINQTNLAIKYVPQISMPDVSDRNDYLGQAYALRALAYFIIRKSKFPQNPKRSVRFSGKGTKRSVQKRKARNTQKTETEGL